MTTLAAYVIEFAPLLAQLEAAAAAGDTASGGKLFEWRIRARLIDEKLRLAAKPAVPPDPEEAVPGILAPQFAFGDKAANCARSALPHVTRLRSALEKGRVPVALEEARAIDRLVTESASI
jgi:hypothetical protein